MQALRSKEILANLAAALKGLESPDLESASHHEN